MKFAAAILFFVMTILTVLPLLSFKIQKTPENCCSSKTKTCHKNPEESTNKNECSTNCNTSISCGYCCWMMVNKFSITAPSELVRQKIIVINDNRTVAHISDCWRPPNFNA